MTMRMHFDGIFTLVMSHVLDYFIHYESSYLVNLNLQWEGKILFDRFFDGIT